MSRIYDQLEADMLDVTGTIVAGAALAAVLTAAIAFVPAARRAFGTIPLPFLIGIHAVRLGGIALVGLALAGVLSGAFPYVAGIGDFVAGAWAIPVARTAARHGRIPDRAVLAWNAFGTLDLVVAGALASHNASLLEIARTGSLSAFIVPAALLLLFVTHAAIFARMRRRPAAADALAHSS